MTVQTNTNVASFNGNGVTQIFPIAFKFNNDTDLVVLLADDAAGVSSSLTLNSDYTVSGEGDEEGGLINVVVAPAVGQRLFVTRLVDILQLTDLRNQGKFFAEVHEDAFDLLTMIAQQHESSINTALRVAESDPLPARLPPASQRAGLLLSFDSDGNPIAVAPTGGSATELALELADSSEISKGAGKVGYNPALQYSAGTVGAAVKENSERVTPLFLRFANSYHVSEWGIEGTEVGAATLNEGAKLLLAVNDVATANGTLLFDARNYTTDRTLLVEGGFRSFKLQGSGTGNSQTAGSAGTTIVSDSNIGPAIRVNFNTFANENFRMGGLSLYDSARNQNGQAAILIVRGDANDRYVSGFVFRDVGISGYGAGIAWQGMNLVDTGLNYFGTNVIDNVSIYQTGVGLLLSNCSLNLLDLRSVLLHSCSAGGIRLERDGLVLAGSGLGSSITAHISGKSHFEDCAGMFRTQQARVLGGKGTGAYLRSTIHMDGLLHEFCGATTNPTTGDPFLLGVDTDVIVTGDVNYELGYGEDSFPFIRTDNTITSSVRMRCNMAGGRSLSPLTVNAPTIRRTIANGASTVFQLTSPETLAFALRSKLILQDGVFGIVEGTHNGTPTGTKYNTVSTPSPAPATSGVTVTYADGAAGDVINCTVLNNSGQSITAELQIENLSSCTILNASEL